MMRFVCVAGVVLSTVMAAWADDKPAVVPALPAGQAGQYRLAWHDEFDGTALDEARWVYRTDSKHWSTQLPANVSVSGGMLRIALKKENTGGRAYTGGGVISKQAFRHGYYEARLKCPPGKGWHTSFWMMAHDGTGGTLPEKARQEVDVLETNSVDLHHYEANLHKWPTAVHKAFGPVPVKTPDLSADFHVFGCLFSADKLEFFFDGKSVGTLDPTKIEHADQNIWLTVIASQLGKTDAVDDTKLPAAAEVDYVRFFEAKSAETK